MSVNVLYRTSAVATGGRDGHARSQDGRLDVQLSTPKELGGAGGEGVNPEQLFAAGYSACFLGALKVAGQQAKVRIPADASVTAAVGIGPRSEGGFGITGRPRYQPAGRRPRRGRGSVAAAHQICPYSNATRNNLDVGLTVA